MTHLEKINDARNELEKTALTYARLKVLGIQIDTDGVTNHYSFNDQKMYTEGWEANLKQAAINLLTALTATPLPERKE